MSRTVIACYLALAVTLASVAGCGLRTSSLGGGWFGGSSRNASLEASNESTSAVPVSTTSRVSISGSKPVDAYVVLGGRIKSCWFNADIPLLRDYVYRADASPDDIKSLGAQARKRSAVFDIITNPTSVFVTGN